MKEGSFREIYIQILAQLYMKRLVYVDGLIHTDRCTSIIPSTYRHTIARISRKLSCSQSLGGQAGLPDGTLRLLGPSQLMLSCI